MILIRSISRKGAKERKVLNSRLTVYSAQSALVVNCQLSIHPIMHYELLLGVPAKPSGFPLYLCSLPSPLSVVELVETPVTSTGSVTCSRSRTYGSSQRMPLQSLTQNAAIKEVTIYNCSDFIHIKNYLLFVRLFFKAIPFAVRRYFCFWSNRSLQLCFLYVISATKL